MMNLTMMQVGAALLWAVLICAPVVLSMAGASELDENNVVIGLLWLWLAIITQTALCISLYVAGGVK